MKNRTFRQALVALSHPLTLLAVMTLLVNNHVLRHTMPSWWTGKLGDVAWLMFAPAMFAAVLSCILPPRLSRRQGIVGYTAFVLVGTGFALANTVPPFNSWSNWLLQRLSGWQPFLVCDPTDLLTMPAILVGWHVWRTSRNASASFTARGWTVLSLAVLSTTATSPLQTDFGAMCLVQQDNVLTVVNYSDAYVSTDGGLVWNLASRYAFDRYETDYVEQEQRYDKSDREWELVDPRDGQVRYRFVHGAGILKSADGGRTWFTDIELPAWTHAQARYYSRFNAQGAPAGDTRGPYDAIFYPDTGNLVVAMGFEGILTKPADDEWKWIDIGPYRHIAPGNLDFVKRLLENEFLLGLLYAALAAITFTRYANPQVKQSGRVSQLVWLGLTGVAWLFWLGAAFSLDFDPSRGPLENLETLFYGFAAGGCVLLMFLLIGISRQRSSLGQNRESFKRAVITAVTGWALFLLPYVLWTRGDIPYYGNATTFAILLALATAVGGYFWIIQTSVEAPA